MKNVDQLDLLSLLPYEESGVVSKQILKEEGSNATVFSIYKGETLSCNSFPHHVLIVGLEGKAELTFEGNKYQIGALESMILPGDVEYAFMALHNFKMLLVSKI